MPYQLEGRLFEVCTCDVLCPCWVGEDPDGGRCYGVVSYRIEQGLIDGLDVSGLTVAWLNDIPGNILAGHWRSVLFVDDRASPRQHQALVDVFTGRLGGPLGDVYQLIGEVAGVERVPITFTIEGGKGTLCLGQAVEAEAVPFTGATGKSTTVHDTLFTTIPGSPAYVGKATQYTLNAQKYGFEPISIQNHNAIQGTFRFEA